MTTQPDSTRPENNPAYSDTSDRKFLQQFETPALNLPKGGGALKGVDEKFQVNAANGTAAFTIPLPFSQSRNGFGPSLSLAYNSGAGNSLFGLGWQCEVPSIRRKTDKQLPRYADADESDVFLFSGAEDLVPYMEQDDSGNWNITAFTAPTGEHIKRYRPRIEGLFARIEQIQPAGETCFYWKVTSRDNTVTFFGRTAASRITHPGDENKIYAWLPDLGYDDKGNCIEYAYTFENTTNVSQDVHERNRLNGTAPFTNTYLKSICYGNENPYYADSRNPYTPVNPDNPAYFFKTVLDYGDHSGLAPADEPDTDWPCRTDAFSDYKPGFEIRTWRLCQRILFFHTFAELSPNGIAEPTLIRSVDFTYQHYNQSEEAYSEADFITSITHTSYERNGADYIYQSLPALTFLYQQLDWNQEVQQTAPDDFTHAPAGLSTNYQWTDFYNEGIAGILTEQADAWYYKSNLGDGHFAHALPVIPKPALAGIANGAVQLQDIEANGKKYIITNTTSLNGFFEQTDTGDWLPFQAFDSKPPVNLNDPNIKLIDLNGDGMPDVVMSEDTVFTWWESKGRQGFEKARHTPKSYDEEKGPSLVFTDTLQQIYLADMSGDGLTDLVRIRNGEVCYWPNLGYGFFGAKVTMHQAPVFDSPDSFNPYYLKLADISGTGASDLVYLGGNTFKVWLNQGGNTWSQPQEIRHFPSTEIPNKVSVMDFLGNGTGCIVWSSPLPGQSHSPMRYIDLMGGNKPYILHTYENGFGKTVNITYKSSTYYYLLDKQNGESWITKLPFPVQCVSQTTTTDAVTDIAFTTSYSYRHGYYDHAEREFRGFGLVIQDDSEDFVAMEGTANATDGRLHQDTVRTKTWFHTGAFFGREKILSQFAEAYYHNPDVTEKSLPQPTFSENLTAQEWREALRACKGMTLRQEVYALDGSELQDMPYTVAEHNCRIALIQPRAGNRNAVFMPNESEAITYHYERNSSDPRIAHSFNLVFDNLGQVLESASVVYSRKMTDTSLPEQVQTEQAKTHIVYQTATYTNDIDTPEAYRLRAICESASWEIQGTTPTGENGYYQISDLLQGFATATHVAYEQEMDGSLQKRNIGLQRVLFSANNTITILPLGNMDSLGLPYESYRLAFTQSLLDNLYGAKVSDTLLTEGGYIRSDDYKAASYFPASDADNEWWIRSGRVMYPSQPELHFYIPTIYQDALGNSTTLTYYSTYHLLVNKTVDALGNTTEVLRFNFRTLSPEKVADINGTISEVAIDTLGLVVATCITGKAGEGDQLTGFTKNLSVSEVAAFFNDPETEAPSLLGQATSRLVYDFSRSNFKAVAVASIVRETHVHELENLSVSATQISIEYSDGFGHVIQKKTQAEPGIAYTTNESGELIETDTGDKMRWVSNGRTIFNNKGKAVKKYEPYFSASPCYDEEKLLTEKGKTALLYYDGLGRLIKTTLPNDTFTYVSFDAWHQKNYDTADTVMQSGWYTLRTSGALASDASELAAANKTVIFADTPNIAYLDTLGRVSVTQSHNAWIDRSTGLKKEEFISLSTTFDIEGNILYKKDGRGLTAISCQYNLTGTCCYQFSMDTHERWLLHDVTGNEIYKWDSRESAFHYHYDALHRLTHTEVTEKDLPLKTVNRLEYGESMGTVANYLKGKLYRQYDGSGIVTNLQYDFKGNLVQTTRQLTDQYTSTPDWTTETDVVLKPEVYETLQLFDALNRITQITTPDNSTIQPGYNAASLINTLQINLHGETAYHFVTDITYNERGQRTAVYYGNDVKTAYTYNQDTFQLTRIYTTRKNGTEIIQDLNYTYDTVGNIVQIKDLSEDTIYFNNAAVNAGCDYTYDALYQLIKAAGREHAGGNLPPDAYDIHRMFTTTPGDGSALQNYEQHYQYDKAGNMTEMRHNAGTGAFINRWTRTFSNDTASGKLLNSQVGGNPAETYTYDTHGNLTQMPHLSSLIWNYADQLTCVVRNSTTTERNFIQTYYTYDNKGQRVRKVTEYANGTREERIYLGPLEYYTQTLGDSIGVVRETLHVMDATQRIALIETLTIENDQPADETLIRYQLNNHIGTACLEVDETANAAIISYEEYYPFGSTSYQARSSTEVPYKRYRYTGKERDDETGLYYHGVRYYCPWLARWTAGDPIGTQDGLNLYSYVKNNPVRIVDPNGTSGEETKIVKPYVLDTLKKYNIPFAEEVEFQMVDGSGKTITGRFDLVIIDPTTNAPLPIELKGSDIDAFSTSGQEFYVRQFETPAGASITITGSNATALGLKPGSVMHVNENSFLRVAQSNMATFSDSVHTATGGKKIVGRYFDDSGYRVFTDQKEYDDFLRSKGIDPATGGALPKPAATPAPKPTPAKPATPATPAPKPAPAATPAPKAATPSTSAARETGEELAQKAEREVVEKAEKELVEEGAQFLTKKAFSAVPIGGIVGEIAFKEEDTSWGEVVVRGVGSEIGVGPLDLTTAYDVATSDPVTNFVTETLDATAALIKYYADPTPYYQAAGF